jgi:hypothetical protein
MAVLGNGIDQGATDCHPREERYRAGHRQKVPIRIKLREKR